MISTNQAVVKGWKIHPIFSYNTQQVDEDGRSRRKQPLLKNWLGKASNDIGQIETWKREPFPMLNGERPSFGLALGEHSGVFVLDVDCKNGARGLESLERLEKKYGNLRNENFFVETPSGGIHIYFEYPEKIDLKNKNKIPGYPGIEIKSTGTFVVLVDDSYRQVNNIENLLPCPDWIKDLYKEDPENDDEETTAEEGRNNYLTRKLGQFRVHGFSKEEATEEAHRINQEEFSKTSKGKLPDKELKTIINSVYKYQKAIATDELTIAKKLILLFKDDIRYVIEHNTFYLYRNGIWVPDENSYVNKSVFDFIPKLILEALKIPEKKNRALMISKIKKLGNSDGHSAIIRVLKILVSISINEFDKDAGIICVNNGVLDLRNRIFSPHDKSKYLTKKMQVNYVEEAKAPRYEQFLNDIFLGDKTLIDYVHRIIGLAMLGRVQENIFPIFYGEGKNGKSQFVDLMGHMFSDYSDNALGEKLMGHSNQSNDYFMADLKSKRIVFASETDKNSYLDVSLVKHATGGELVKARPIYGKPFTFRPQYVIILSTNNKPKIRDNSLGMWRRVKLIPFNYTVPEEKKIVEIGTLLYKEESSGILNYWINGLKDYQDNGMQEPKIISDETDKYKQEQNMILNFSNEKLSVDAKGTITVKMLYDTFKEWCNENGEIGSKFINRSKFFDELKRQHKHITKRHTNTGTVVDGITFKDDKGEDIQF